MSLEIYGYYIDEEKLENKKSIIMGFLKQTKNMPGWLKNNGNMELIYELKKDKKNISTWVWKPKRERWGRMATQKRQSDTVLIKEDIEAKTEAEAEAEAETNNNKETRKNRRKIKQYEKSGKKRTKW